MQRPSITCNPHRERKAPIHPSHHPQRLHCTLTRIINPSHPSIHQDPLKPSTDTRDLSLSNTNPRSAPEREIELAIAIATVAISHRPHPIDPAATNHKTFLLAQRVAVTIPGSLRTQAEELFRYRPRIVGRSEPEDVVGGKAYSYPPTCMMYMSANGETTSCGVCTRVTL